MSISYEDFEDHWKQSLIENERLDKEIAKIKNETLKHIEVILSNPQRYSQHIVMDALKIKESLTN